MAGNQQAFTQWMTGTADPTPTGPMGPQPVFRSAKDQMLTMYGRTPEAMYPDGYLGSEPTNTRRGDKLLKAVNRSNTRPYSRGVHKGERINPGDYMWPEEFNPMSGIKNELTGMRFVSVGAETVQLTNEGKVGPRGLPRGVGRPEVEQISEQRRSMLKSLLPQWR